MEMTPVASSTIKSVGYDEPSQTLHVQFVNGGLYEYKGVGKDLYDEWNQADSAGIYFAKYIRPRFSGTKLVEKTPLEVERERVANSIVGYWRENDSVDQAFVEQMLTAFRNFKA